MGWDAIAWIWATGGVCLGVMGIAWAERRFASHHVRVLECWRRYACHHDGCSMINPVIGRGWKAPECDCGYTTANNYMEGQ